jgi:hypothetical protein
MFGTTHRNSLTTMGRFRRLFCGTQGGNAPTEPQADDYDAAVEVLHTSSFLMAGSDADCAHGSSVAGREQSDKGIGRGRPIALLRWRGEGNTKVQWTSFTDWRIVPPWSPSGGRV